MTFQIVAIIILLAFYGCYLGKMLLQKKQGIQTDQMGKGKKGTEKTIELTMKITGAPASPIQIKPNSSQMASTRSAAIPHSSASISYTSESC